MKNKRTKIIRSVFILVLLIMLVVGCIKIYYSNRNGVFVFDADENNKIINIEKENKELSLKELSNIVFAVNKDNKKATEMSDLELVRAAVAISTKYIDTITGTEIKKIVKDYFNIDNVKFVDIPCNLPMSEEHDNRMYIYNSKTDKYESNPEHLGHGGSSNGISYYIMNKKETTEGNYYVYSGNIFYVDNGCIWDTCGSTGMYDVYLSYSDASNKVNKQFNAYEKEELCNNTCDNDKIYEEIKDNVKTIKFYYKKKTDNYVFDHYEIK